MAEWKTFKITVPGGDIFEDVRSLLETLLVYLEVLKAILDTVKSFLVDFGNPIAALVQALIALIESLFNALKQTGLYALYDLPPPEDVNFTGFVGGYNGFVSRWVGSLYDTKDPNRPQPIPGANQSGYVLFYLEDTNINSLIDKIKALLKFFGGEFRLPRYAAPVGVRVFPVNDKRDPILSASAVFQSKPTALVLEWGSPSDIAVPVTNAASLLMNTGREFVPPKFLIERSEGSASPPVYQILSLTSFQKKGNPVYTTVPVRETTTREPFLLFQNATTVKPGENTATFLSGATGTYRFIDTSVEPNKTYHYRVRAYSGELTVSPDGTIPFGTPTRSPNSDSSDYTLDYPGVGLILGNPSSVVTGRLPSTPEDYNVVGTLESLFLTLFAFNFHRNPDPDATFDTSGRNTGVTGPAQIGRGSITPILANTVTEEMSPYATFSPSPVDGSFPTLPWEKATVQSRTRVLANTVASAMLANPGTAQQFRSLMLGPLPFTPIVSYGLLQNTVNIQNIVEAIPIQSKDATQFGITPQIVNETYLRAFADGNTRMNLLRVFQFIRSFTLGGKSPDWFSIALLRDVIPWSGQILYELLNKIQALVDAFNGTMAEIRSFIEMIERKIQTLENFVRFIIGILDAIESLSISARVLFVDAGNGGIPAWIGALNSAEGDKPSAGPEEYACSLTVAYSAVDAVAYKTALSLLFGGSLCSIFSVPSILLNGNVSFPLFVRVFPMYLPELFILRRKLPE